MRFSVVMRYGTKYKSRSLADYLNIFHKEYDLTLKGLLKSADRMKMRAVKDVNQFFAADYAKFGPELHSASYTLKLGGQCRLSGSSKWIRMDKDENILPKERSSNLIVEGLDLSKTVIQFEGISNIENCSHLQTLIVNNGYFFDDWCLRKIAHAFSHTLVNLDISNCSLVTDDGLLALGYLKNLKNLKIENLSSCKNKEFISILLEENNPGLEVLGANHLSEETLKTVETKLNKEISDLKIK